MNADLEIADIARHRNEIARHLQTRLYHGM